MTKNFLADLQEIIQ